MDFGQFYNVWPSQKMASSLFTLMISSIVYVDYCFAKPDSQTKFYQSQLKILGTFSSKVGIAENAQ